jgi:hypothetical protein
MTDISCGARSVRARMEHYFRTEDLIETLTQQVAAVEQQVTALEAWIASDATYPSQGVAQYTPGRGRRGANYERRWRIRHRRNWRKIGRRDRDCWDG